MQGSESLLATEPTGGVPGEQRFWLITRRLGGRIEALSMAGGGTIPVFSFEEEADAFLRFGTLEEGWRVRPLSAGELVSVLEGPRAGATTKVALDPLPEACGSSLVDLVSLAREDFLRALADGRQRPNQGGAKRYRRTREA